jgi:hypothetical protein
LFCFLANNTRQGDLRGKSDSCVKGQLENNRHRELWWVPEQESNMIKPELEGRQERLGEQNTVTDSLIVRYKKDPAIQMCVHMSVCTCVSTLNVQVQDSV